MDSSRYVTFKGGFAIWEEEYAWSIVYGEKNSQDSVEQSVNAEIAFEIEDIKTLWIKLIEYGVEVVHPIREQPWGQQVCRIYDPDGHLIEFGEPMWVVVRRFAEEGMTAEEVAQRTSMPLPIVQQILEVE